MMLDESQNLERGGADFILLCANTLHITEPFLKDKVKIPVLHIVDALAVKIKEKGFTKV